MISEKEGKILSKRKNVIENQIPKGKHGSKTDSFFDLFGVKNTEKKYLILF